MLDNTTLDILFRKARSHNGWLEQGVSDDEIHQIYNIMKFGATSANNCPARITFIKSDEAKEKLKPYLSEGNIDKSMSAPAVAIISYDVEFYEKLPYLFPHDDARSWYAGKPDKITSAGTLNAILQGAYFMIAARAIGLDCGPMIGFNNEALDQEFFPDGLTKSIFLCGIGHGDNTKIFPRSPRLSFEDACSII